MDTLLFTSKFLKQREYWLSLLSDKANAPATTFHFPGGPLPAGHSREKREHREIRLSAELCALLLKSGKGNDISLYLLLLTALKILIYRYTGKEDIIVISPLLEQKKAKDTVNDRVFICGEITPGITFKELLLDTRKAVLGAYGNQDYPLDKIIDFLSGEEAPGGEFSHIACSLENIHGNYDNTGLVFTFKREGNDISGVFSYDPAVCGSFYARQAARQFVQQLQSALDDIEGDVSCLPFLSQEDKKQLLEDFNDNRADLPANKTVACLFAEEAVKNPYKSAIVYEDQVLTYERVNHRAGRLARVLRQKGLTNDSLAAVLMERSPQMVEGILAAWKAGGAYLPIDPDYPQERIDYIMADSGAKLLLSGGVEFNVQNSTLNIEQRKLNNPLAYVIYTSGSTGKPKGAMVEQAGMLNHILAKINGLQIDGDAVIAQNASHTFDISVWQFFAALAVGGTTVIYSNRLVLQPEQFINRITADKIDFLEVVPSYLSLLLDAFEGEFKYLRYLLVTGETVPHTLVKRWFSRYAIPMINAYGPTEASDDITHHVMVEAPVNQSVPIGSPLQNLTIYIVDKRMQLCPVGVKGEILVAGIGVGRGYLNNPTRTGEVFIPNPFNKAKVLWGPGAVFQKSPWPPEACFYKTGDSGCWTENGTIEFFGRMDQQVKIRGFRIEPGEIEQRLLNHPAVKEAVVTVKEFPGKDSGSELVAYIVWVDGGEGKTNKDKLELQDYLSESLPLHMVPLYFVGLDQLPLTSNGKVDKKNLPAPEESALNRGDYVAPADPLEEKLVEIWQRVLDRNKIGIDDSFFDLGGHSLNATRMVSAIYKELSVEIGLRDIFTFPTIAGIARIIREKTRTEYSEIQPAAEREYYEVSHAQRRLWVLDRFDGLGPAYNMPAALNLSGGLDTGALNRAFRAVIQRHESLRTSFSTVDGVPVQVIHKDMDFVLEEIFLLEEAEPSKREELAKQVARRHAGRVFDLTGAPLLNAALLKISQTPDRHILLFNMHHIIGDGWSLDILIKELVVYYNSFCTEPPPGLASLLPPLRIQYRDYARWQNAWLSSALVGKHREYWHKKLSVEGGGDIPVLNFPADYPRPPVKTFNGNIMYFVLDKELSAGLSRLYGEHGVTLFMILLAAVKVFSFRYTGQEDIIIGSPAAGRNHPDLEEQIGFYVNTLALRSRVIGDEGFDSFLHRVKQTAEEAYENQTYPFDKLVDELNLTRDTARQPLFDVMVVMENNPRARLNFDGIAISTFNAGAHHGTSKFDLIFCFSEMADGISMSIEYNTDLFKADRIRRSYIHFSQLVKSITRDAAQKIQHIDILTGQEKQRLLVEFNDTNVEFPRRKTIVDLFTEQAERVPDHTAVIDAGKRKQHLTYRQLNKKFHGLALSLVEHYGIKPGDIIAVQAERSHWVMVALLAIFKTGGVYLPIDPGYPKDRVDFMLNDSRARVLPGFVLVDSPLERGAPKGWGVSGPANRGHHPAYIIYTSGSTGKPKGVMGTYGCLTNLIHWQMDRYRRENGFITMLYSALNFDVSLQEMLFSACSGGAIHIIPDDLKRDPDRLLSFIAAAKIQSITLPFSALNLLFYKPGIVENILSLKHIITSGEQLQLTENLRRFLEARPDVTLDNQYGPSETHVVTGFIISKARDNISPLPPIGKPIANTRCFILDRAMNPVPIGIGAELYLSGANLAAGYLNRPQLTAERFCFRRPGGLFLKKPPPWTPRKNFLLVKQKFCGGPGGGFSKEPPGRRRHYKTGDLARWLVDGNIEFLGRIDSQVKIRGFRVEPGEIENRLLSHEAIKEAVVIVKEDKKGGKYLCAYIVPGTIGEPGLREYLSRTLPGYMIPSYFVPMETIPLTASGKVDRKGLPAPGLGGRGGGGGRYVAPRNEIEKTLAGIWAGVLMKDTAIGIDDNFFELGGQSLKAAVLSARIHKETDVEIPMEEIFKNPTIRGLANYIGRSGKSMYVSILPVEKRDYYPMSSAQKRLFLIDRFENTGTGYNMTAVFKMAGELDGEELEKALQKLIRRHESLGTSFHLIAEGLVQRVHKEVEFHLDLHDLRDLHDSDAFLKRFIRPFDLSKAPLLRVGLATLKGGNYLLLFDMHHIIGDGTSLGILADDFARLHEPGSEPGPGSEAPAPLRIQYKDFAPWWNDLLTGSKIKGQENYWLNLYPDPEDIPLLNLPLDFPRPPVFSFAGNSYGAGLNAEITSGIKGLGARSGATLFMTLLAAFNILLYKTGGLEDIVVGTAVQGRPHADLYPIMGMFVNSLALRNCPMGHKTPLQFLEEVKENSVKAFENRDYPFEDLVERLKPRRDPSRNPVFDVMMVVQNFQPAAKEVTSLKLVPYPWENKTAKFDITLSVMETADEIYFGLEYCTALFKEETIKQLADRYISVIRQMVRAPGTTIGEMDILTAEEKQRLLYGFNNPTTAYPKDKTVVDLFEEQAEKGPGRIALAAGREFLTYRELNKTADRLAYVLAEKGVLPGTIAGLMMERSTGMIVGILAILKAGAAYLPIDPNSPAERKKYMLADSDARVLVTTATLAEAENKKKGHKDAKLRPAPCALRHAYLIYTSGSTGKPKGVLITHANLSPLLHWGYNHLGISPADRTVQNLAYFFDWSVWEIFITLTSGAVLYIVPEEVVLDPEAQVDFIDRHGITVLHATPTQYRGLVGVGRKTKTLKYLFLGAEQLTVDLLERSLECVEPGCRVFNMYGPTEATIISAVLEIHRAEPAGYRQLPGVPIGKPVGNTVLLVLDRDLNLCPIHRQGELYITGPGTAPGYLNNPELTSEKFLTAKTREGTRSFNMSYRSYRTGDLARWLSDGNIEFLGRLDFQVKIRGFRIELSEIENCLLKHKDIHGAVVMDLNDENNEKYLCAYIVSRNRLSPDRLRAYLSGQLPGYMIPAYFIEVEKIPLTANGKVNRKALPAPHIEAGAGDRYVPPRSLLEEKIVAIWSDILNIGKDKISIDAGFFELGGHSLKAAVLTTKIHERLNAKLSLAEVFKRKTVRGLAEYIENAEENTFARLEPVEKKEYYPLSSAQQRLYFIQQMAPGSTVYNIPMCMGTAVDGDREKTVKSLEKVFRRLIARHESLRTSFHMHAGRPVQKVHAEAEFKLEYYDSAGIAEEEAITGSFVRPFDLTEAPLLRVGLLKQDRRQYILMLDIHHIVTDKTSQDVLLDEFMKLAAGEDAPLKLYYKDYAQWQQGEEQKAAIKKQEEYWLKTFADEVPVLQLPGDYPRPSPQSFVGDTVTFYLGAKETRSLRRLAEENQATLYMVLLAVFNVFLSRLSGQEDIVVGTPAAGRKHVDLARVIGVFVNTLALRNFPHKEETFNRFLGRVKKQMLEAFENSDYPYEALIDVLPVERDVSRNPLFDTMFSFHDLDIPAVTTGFDNRNLTGTSKFDLTLQAFAGEENILVRFEACTELFKLSTIQRFSGYFKTLISGAAAKPSARLYEIEMITEHEKKQLLHDFNDAAVEYPHHKTIHGLFAEQVEKTPDNIAVVFHDVDVTYRELNKKSGQVACLLKERGVPAGHIVAIMMKRSIEMIIGILGILKAGAAYLPIDPDTPEKRKQYMMADSGAGILITTNSPLLASPPSPLTPHPSPLTSLAYVIYTSGTTGRPKGTLVEHRNVTRLTGNTNYIELTARDRVLQLSNYTFDVSVFDIFASLLNGAVLVMMDREDVLSVHRLFGLLKKEAITVFFVTTALFNTLVDLKIDCFVGVGKVLFGGEKVSPEHARKALQYLGKDKIIHVYGPTEATVFATYYNLDQVDESASTIPIGRPLSNTIVYILDGNSQPVPLGVFGEIYIGGPATARGYLNNPELTAKKFCLRRHYKTGDLARWLPDGNIEFLGRIDSQVKIRGFRIEVGEIEGLLRGHDAIKEAVVVVHDDEAGDKYLSAYIVPCAGGLSLPGVRRYLSGKLPAYMIPAYFIEVENIPLNASGKVDGKALAQFQVPGFETQNEFTAPRDEIEKTLAQIWSEVLNVKGPIGIDDSFFERGGHSLKGTILMAKIHDRLKVRVPLAEIFNTPTIRGLSGYIAKTAPAEYAPAAAVEAVEKKEFYPLSFNQQKLWTIQRLEPESRAYNMPALVVLKQAIEGEKVKKVIQMLIRRHAAFRTCFAVMKNEPVQFVVNNVDIPFRMMDISSLQGEEKEKKREQVYNEVSRPPFDFSKAPLFRSVLLKVNREEYHFLFNMHHIISDGWSMEILKKEFSLLYEAYSAGKDRESEPAPLGGQYVDFVAWQRKQLDHPATKEKSRLFWRERIAEGLPRLRLPVDYADAPENDAGRESAGYRFAVKAPVTRTLLQLAQDNHTGIYVVVFSILNLLLARLSGEKDIVVGLVGAGREHVKLQDMVGYFVNTLVLKNRIDYRSTYLAFLGRVNGRVMELMRHQHYPLESVLEELKLRFPDISVQFNMFNMNETTAGEPLEPFESHHLEKAQDAKFDMSVTATLFSNGIEIQCYYRKRLFKKETVAYMMGQFDRLFEKIAGNPHLQLKEYIFKKKKKRIGVSP